MNAFTIQMSQAQIDTILKGLRALSAEPENDEGSDPATLIDLFLDVHPNGLNGFVL